MSFRTRTASIYDGEISLLVQSRHDARNRDVRFTPESGHW
jgi:hypothetical protein